VRIREFTVIGLILLVAAEPASKPSAPKITVAKDITHAIGPLREDGTVDYVAAINARMSAGVTPENNAAVGLLRVLGPHGLRMNPQAKLKLWPALGIEPLPAEGPYLVALDELPRGPDFDAKEALALELEKSENRPWTAAEYPALTKWAAQQDKAIDRIFQASRLPKYCVPLVSDSEPPTVFGAAATGFYGVRTAAQALSYRARLRLAAGDFDGYRADALAIARLARLATSRPMLIDRLVAQGCDAVAVDLFSHAAVTEQLSAAQAKTLLKDLEQIPPMPLIADAVDLGERYVLLDLVTTAANVGWVKAIQSLAGRGDGRVLFAGKQTRDWSEVLRKINARYDRIVRAHSMPTYAERIAALRVVDEEMEGLHVRVTGPLGVFAPIEDRVFSLLAPVLSRTSATQQETVTRHDLARVAAALAAFRAEHGGAYPQSHEALVPGYLAKLPPDEFALSTPAFQYEVNAFGGYRVASVGRDGTNDRKRLDENMSADDIVILGGKQPEPPKEEQKVPDGDENDTPDVGPI
jgi:hypothetical protein